MSAPKCEECKYHSEVWAGVTKIIRIELCNHDARAAIGGIAAVERMKEFGNCDPDAKLFQPRDKLSQP